MKCALVNLVCECGLHPVVSRLGDGVAQVWDTLLRRKQLGFASRRVHYVSFFFFFSNEKNELMKNERKLLWMTEVTNRLVDLEGNRKPPHYLPKISCMLCGRFWLQFWRMHEKERWYEMKAVTFCVMLWLSDVKVRTGVGHRILHPTVTQADRVR